MVLEQNSVPSMAYANIRKNGHFSKMDFHEI